MLPKKPINHKPEFLFALILWMLGSIVLITGCTAETSTPTSERSTDLSSATSKTEGVVINTELEETSNVSTNQSIAQNQVPVSRSEVIDRLMEDGVLTILVKENLPPFSYPDRDEGFDIDLAYELAARWGIPRENVNIEREKPARILSRLFDDTNVDLVIGAVTHSWERDIIGINNNPDVTFDASQPYLVDAQALVIPRDSELNIKTVLDLNGKKVVVVENTTAHRITCERTDIELECESHPNREEALKRLIEDSERETGNADETEKVVAFISDRIAVAQLIAPPEYQDKVELVIDKQIGQPYTFTQEPYVIVIRQDDNYLRELVNATLQAMKKDGFYNALYIKHFRKLGGVPEPYDIWLSPDESTWPGLDSLTRSYSKIELIELRGRVLVAGVKCDTPPFGYLEDGEHKGFDVELIEKMREVWSINAVNYVCVTSENRIEKLLNNEIDLITASMTITWGRKNFITMSDEYFKDGQTFMVRSNSTISEFRDVAGQRVAVVRGSTAVENLERLTQETGISVEPILVDTPKDAIDALLEERVAAFLNDSVILTELQEQRFGQQSEDDVVNMPVKVLATLMTGKEFEYYGIGLSKGDIHFKQLVNCALQKIAYEGDYAKIYKKYIDPEKAVPFDITIYPDVDEDLRCIFDDVPKSLEVVETSLLIENIIKSKAITVGVRSDFAPFGSDGKGFEIEIVRELARRWYNGDESKIKLKQLTGAEREDALRNEEVHLLVAAFTHTFERDEEFDFGLVYFVDGQSLLVRIDSGITSLMDLENKSIGVINNSTSERNIEIILNVLGIEAIVEDDYNDASDAIADLLAGRVDAVTSDSFVLKQFEREHSGELIVVGEPFSTEPYGVAYNQYDNQLQDLINITLQEMKRDGTYDALYCNTFRDEPTALPPYGIITWLIDSNQSEYEGINFKRLSDQNEVSSTCPVVEVETVKAIPINALTSHIVEEGDTLSGLAGEYYGDIQQWRKIHEANRDVIGSEPNELEVGTTLVIPE